MQLHEMVAVHAPYGGAGREDGPGAGCRTCTLGPGSDNEVRVPWPCPPLGRELLKHADLDPIETSLEAATGELAAANDRVVAATQQSARLAAELHQAEAREERLRDAVRRALREAVRDGHSIAASRIEAALVEVPRPRRTVPPVDGQQPLGGDAEIHDNS